jgi:hypothetical protein
LFPHKHVCCGIVFSLFIKDNDFSKFFFGRPRTIDINNQRAFLHKHKHGFALTFKKWEREKEKKRNRERTWESNRHKTDHHSHHKVLEEWERVRVRVSERERDFHCIQISSQIVTYLLWKFVTETPLSLFSSLLIVSGFFIYSDMLKKLIKQVQMLVC